MKYLRNEKGAALILVIIVMVVVSILGVALLTTSLADARNSQWQADRLQAHFLARSAVEMGIKIRNTLLDSSLYTGTTEELAAALNLQVKDSNPYTVPGVGTFRIDFELGDYSELKIVGTGTTVGILTTDQVVTYTEGLSSGYTWANPALDWMTGINLEKSITADSKSYLGHAVWLATKNSKNAVQSPKAPKESSTFQASLIAFGEYLGMSLIQVTNSINMTLDAEIIYFLGSVQLESKGVPLLLSSSERVLTQHTKSYDIDYPRAPGVLSYDGVDGVESGVVGFESIERYKAFVNDVSLDALFWHPTTTFEPGNYGIVKLGGGVLDDKGNSVFAVADKGYYYFKSGLDLTTVDTIGPLGNSKLIKILDNDPVVRRLDALIALTYGLVPPFWSDK